MYTEKLKYMFNKSVNDCETQTSMDNDEIENFKIMIFGYNTYEECMHQAGASSPS